MVDKAKVAGMLPEEMIAGGLLDDVDGIIMKARFVPWDYMGNIPNHILAVRLSIQPIDNAGKNDGDLYEQFYSAGDLDQYVPSIDGEAPAPGLEHFGERDNDDTLAEGPFAFRVGKKEGLSNTSNWAHFLMAALDAKFPRDKFSADIRFVEGTKAHFNRIPQKKRAGLVKATSATDGGKKKNDDILVITEFKGFVNPTSAGGTATKSSTSTPASTPSTPAPSASSPASASDLDTMLVGLVKEAVAGSPDGFPKSKLPSVVLSKAPAALKGKGVARVVAAEFLSGHEDQWAYDPDSGTLYNV